MEISTSKYGSTHEVTFTDENTSIVVNVGGYDKSSLIQVLLETAYQLADYDAEFIDMVSEASGLEIEEK